MNEEAVTKLNTALEKLPGIEKRIVTKQPPEKMQQGKQRLALLGADIASVIAMLDGGIEDPPVDIPPVDIPNSNGSWKLSLKPKDNAIDGKTFTDPGWMKNGNTDLVDCIFTKNALHSDNIAKNVRLFNPIFKDITPFDIGGSGSGTTFAWYINMGKIGEQRLGFVISGGRALGLKVTEFMETKDFDPYADGIDFSESPDIKGGFRIRHGAGALISNCKGLKKVTLRGHHHAVINCPDTVVDILAGNISAYFDVWIKQKADKVGNYQSTDLCYVDGVKGVNCGAQMQQKTPVKAKRCMVAPGQAHKLLEQEGFMERKLSSMDELLKMH